jgi:hypothetical protein
VDIEVVEIGGVVAEGDTEDLGDGEPTALHDALREEYASQLHR